MSDILTELRDCKQKFRCVVADPPWQYGKWGKASEKAFLVSGICEETNKEIPMPYPTMTVADIAALPVAGCASEDCDLYLWATQKYLPGAFIVMQAWGFRYCQTLTWCKAPRGLGQGGLFCPTSEFLLLGRKGRMPQGKRRVDSTWWQVKRPHNSHSTKPEFFQDMVETVSDGPRLELFARRARPGWTTIGNEADGMDVKDSLILLAQGRHPCYGVEKHGESRHEKDV